MAEPIETTQQEASKKDYSSLNQDLQSFVDTVKRAWTEKSKWRIRGWILPLTMLVVGEIIICKIINTVYPALLVIETEGGNQIPIEMVVKYVSRERKKKTILYSDYL